MKRLDPCCGAVSSGLSIENRISNYEYIGISSIKDLLEKDNKNSLHINLYLFLLNMVRN